MINVKDHAAHCRMAREVIINKYQVPGINWRYYYYILIICYYYYTTATTTATTATNTTTPLINHYYYYYFYYYYHLRVAVVESRGPQSVAQQAIQRVFLMRLRRVGRGRDPQQAVPHKSIFDVYMFFVCQPLRLLCVMSFKKGE